MPYFGHLFASSQAIIAGIMMARTKFRSNNSISKPRKMPSHLFTPIFFSLLPKYI